MNLPFRWGWPGFPPRAPGPILTPPLVAPDCNTLSVLSTFLETTQAKKNDVFKLFHSFFPCDVRLTQRGPNSGSLQTPKYLVTPPGTAGRHYSRSDLVFMIRTTTTFYGLFQDCNILKVLFVCFFETHLDRLRLCLLSLERERLLWPPRELWESPLGHNLCGGLFQ